MIHQDLLSRYPGLLVGGLLAAPVAELRQIKLPLNLFLVLMSIIIPPLADGATEGYEVIRIFHLGHMGT